MPEVTVLMSVYNSEKFLHESVMSILNQTYTDFELLIIDDCSTDSSYDVLSSFNDPRIRIVRNEANLGLTKSLNKGLALADSKYLARLDADDISEPSRLAEQVDFLEHSPNIDVLGTWIKYIDESGNITGHAQFSTEPDIIKLELAFGNVVVHPSITARLDVVRRVGGYDESYKYAQDYALWTNIVISGGSIANIPKELIKYRTGEGQITIAKREQQLECATNMTKGYVDRLLSEDVSLDTVKLLRQMLGTDSCDCKSDMRKPLQLANEVWNVMMMSTSNNKCRLKAAFSRRLIKKAAPLSHRSPDVAIRLVFWSIRIKPVLLLETGVLRLILKCCYYRLRLWNK